MISHLTYPTPLWTNRLSRAKVPTVSANMCPKIFQQMAGINYMRSLAIRGHYEIADELIMTVMENLWSDTSSSHHIPALARAIDAFATRLCPTLNMLSARSASALDLAHLALFKQILHALGKER
eukprot:2995479-Amphidinium_carterae.1